MEDQVVNVDGDVGDWTDAVIVNGFVQKGYIEEEFGLHPELRFTFCPMLPEDVELVDEKVRTAANGSDAIRLMAKVCQSRIKSWSLKHPITEDNVRRLRPLLLQSVYRVLTNKKAVDRDPKDAEVNSTEAEGSIDDVVAKLGK